MKYRVRMRETVVVEVVVEGVDAHSARVAARGGHHEQRQELETESWDILGVEPLDPTIGRPSAVTEEQQHG